MSLPDLKYAGILLLLIIFQGCGPGRAVSEPSSPQPDWVRSRPVSPGYYIGIGWAQKTRNVHQYQQTARQNAMADLAGEISVTISSNSVLHAFESQLGFREDYTSTIQARTQEVLEGYELTDTWEDQENYWIYYRLPAARHREITERRRNDAAKLSAGYLDNALKIREEGQVRNSLVHLINSMEAIKNYFDDPLPVEFMGRDIQLGNEIFNQLSSTISGIDIIPEQSTLEIKTGHEVPSSLLRFSVRDQTGKPVADFPLVAAFSERPVRNNRTRTGRDGSAGFGIDVVRSSGPFETFTVRADMEAIVAEATTDPVIRRLIGRFGLPEGAVRINILPPVIMLVTNEENMGNKLSHGSLGEVFRKSAVEAGYLIDDNRSKADYIVRITASATAVGEAGTYRNALLTGNISVELPGGTTIYHRELEGFRGSHFEPGRAGEEAYRQAARRMESSYFREIDETIRRRPPL